MKKTPKNLICFSHLRWNFVYQRPQHIITKLSESFNTFFIEEPIFDAEDQAYFSSSQINSSLSVLVPHLLPGLTAEEQILQQELLLKNIIKTDRVKEFIFWYYTPMALEFTGAFSPALIVYDCMDELSAFKFAPEKLKALEFKLMEKADLVFTGGHTLYQEKKKYHSNIHPFPSSIDKNHFGKARNAAGSPQDQQDIEGVKLGFFGVIDERFDIDLIKKMAEIRPEWQFILIGPVVKIEPKSLPNANNIHYLGKRLYDELPAYLSGWDIALIPFLLNESTKYISPTKTPEYLAAGIPVISTPIRDVVSPYGMRKLVDIGSTAQEFVALAESELAMTEKGRWLAHVDDFLKDMSWDNTARDMFDLMEQQLEKIEKSYTINELSNV